MKELTLVEITDEEPMKEWAKKLMGDRKQEAVESLKGEKVEQETVFLIKIENKNYLAFYMKGEMLPSDMNLKVNKDHAEVKARSGFQRRIDGTLLYDLP